jgi:methylated-DNA-protein-cysteine methyltransferase-like protein
MAEPIRKKPAEPCAGMNELHERFRHWVRQVPAGRVASYGQIAKLAGSPRHVGYALLALPDGTDLPWHRILNAQGRIAKRDPLDEREQRRRLEAEGIAFTNDRVSLRIYGWQPNTVFEG